MNYFSSDKSGSEPTSVVEIDFVRAAVGALLLSQLLQSEVGEFQNEATVYHAVRTLQVSVRTYFAAVYVRHALCAVKTQAHTHIHDKAHQDPMSFSSCWTEPVTPLIDIYEQ